MINRETIITVAERLNGVQDYSGKWYFTEENFIRVAKYLYLMGYSARGNSEIEQEEILK